MRTAHGVAFSKLDGNTFRTRCFCGFEATEEKKSEFGSLATTERRVYTHAAELGMCDSCPCERVPEDTCDCACHDAWRFIYQRPVAEREEVA